MHEESRMSMSARDVSRLRLLILLAIGLTLTVIILGAFTRLTHAGLGCPDWPTCYGHLWVPDHPEEIARANTLFPDTPVETDKTWPEQVHRLFASSLGLFCLAQLLLTARHYQRQEWWPQATILVMLVVATVARTRAGPALDVWLLAIASAYLVSLIFVSAPRLRMALLIAGWVILQGLFGMWTVTLKLWPQVVTGHLLGGMTLLSLLWWQWLRLKPATHLSLVNGSEKIQGLFIAALGVLTFQIALGGWTSSNYAALACPDFPLCHQELWPDPDFTKGLDLTQSIGPNYLGGQLDNPARVAIHISHRLGALVTTIILVVLAFRLHASGLSGHAGLLITALAVQLSLGISNVLFYLPLSIAVLHNAGAAFLLVSLLAAGNAVFPLRSKSYDTVSVN